MDGWPDESICRPKSPTSSDYNCLGWAVERKIAEAEYWWPPVPKSASPLTNAGTKWPAHLPQDYRKVETFTAFLAEYGYEPAPDDEDGHWDPALDKIVMYLKDGIPEHFARQGVDEWWCSKIGELADAVHYQPNGAECPNLGEVHSFYRRPRRNPLPDPPGTTW